MRFLALMLLALTLAAPSAAQTPVRDFPFATPAGEYRDLVVPLDAARSVRLVFPMVRVERAAEGRAMLHPGGDGRVVVQGAGADGAFHSLAELYVADTPLSLRREGGRAILSGAARALALPVAGRPPGAALGVVTFEGMTARLSWGVSGEARTPAFAVEARGARIERALLGLPAIAPAALETGPLSLRGGLSLEDGARRIGAGMRRVRLDEGRVALLGGGIALDGTADLARGLPGPADALRGTLRLRDVAGMARRAMAARLVPAERIMPLVALAGMLGRPEGADTLVLDAATAADGTLILNDRPTALRLPR